MSLHIDQLPLEIRAHIISYVPQTNFPILLRVSKHFRKLVVPLIWTDIELHSLNWHEYYEYKKAYDYMERRHISKSRNYILEEGCLTHKHTSIAYGGGCGDDRRSMHFLQCLSRVKHSRTSHLGHFGGDVPWHLTKSSCIHVSFERHDWTEAGLLFSIWSPFAMLQNLESLELNVEWARMAKYWDEQVWQFDKDKPVTPLRKLHTLKLRGYVPRNFALWILSYPEQLTTLELSILDRPISSPCCHSPTNPPPIFQRDLNPLEDFEDDGGDVPWVTEVSDSDDEAEDFDVVDMVAPRALSILQDTDIPERLKALTSLTLVRPILSHEGEDEDGNQFEYRAREVYCSVPSDNAILQDWARLIRATRRTLQNLTLDQRPVRESTDEEGWAQTEYLELFPYGPGFRRFKEAVLPPLCEGEGPVEWPALRTLRFYGFDPPEPRLTKNHRRVPRSWPSQEFKARNTFLPDMRKRFEPLGVAVHSPLGLTMVFEDETGVVLTADGLGGRPSDEDGDDEEIHV